MTKRDSEIKQLVESIKRGTLYLGGDTFTIHEIAWRHKVHSGQAQKALQQLVDDGSIAYHSSNTESVYVRRYRPNHLITGRLANYSPSILEDELTPSTRFIYKGGLNCGSKA